ncbi:protein turtle [Trichonephila inaurata madagascariensis]|uniref:Protein turtle n=1 Tax=Trichonephila inaurata madagascariensis TaxID=2747483 RepID=A0A8X6YD06_9ARAC|nr:protein turtle [Trichonephila inaurata madagascariensis]
MVMKKTCHFIVFISVCSFTVYSGITQSEPEYTTALLGEDVILPCTFSFPEGTPVPYVVQWQKQDVKIPIYIWYDGYPPHAGEGYEGRASLGGLAALNLTAVRESDQGWYECKVYFLNRPPDSPKNGSWVHLDVLAPPHFKLKPPDTVYVKVGESVTLSCEAIGTPLPVISWSKDNLPLQPSPSIQITATELRINNIQQSDIGDYLCVAANKEGKVNALTKVIVAGKILFAIFKNINHLIKSSLLRGRLILLECLENGLSGTGELLVSKSVTLAVEGDTSGTVISVDGTSGIEDEPYSLFRSLEISSAVSAC